MRRSFIVIAVCVIGSGVAAPSLGAEEPPVCTLIGCVSGVRIEVANAKEGVDRLRFCIQKRCKGIDVKRNGRAPFTRIKVVCTQEITLPGVLVAWDSDGRKLGRYTATVPIKAHQPNGPNCPPTCFTAAVRTNGAGLVVLPQT